ncbi:SDR family oxidoreductase [Rubrimonas cliftonensis]|uniref:3-oxoacyl-[acyl-carrier protein] reductase n=1 Tax=Rubrimonas cliftonensis TaxID=89524 RepID=A0A1H4CNT2_9RHOB|nr:SDR family oxidoreductase [Rubrimonas cliftonensis]SEA61983.1 3-oxoacyl-[acyl-carrier protein] reductase [Rubrimonas cliftonensis]
MDMGIRGRTAIVCAGSKGLGKGCALALAGEGVNIVLNARSAGPLEETAAELRRLGATVTTVAADVTTDEGRAALIAACPNPDILVNNAGGPPPGLWSDWGREAWQAALEMSMLAPIFLTTALLPGMMERGWGRVVNITSQSVKGPIPQLGLSNAARAGLTGFVAGTSRQVAGKGVTINNLLPGSHATDRATALEKAVASQKGVSLEEASAIRKASIPAGRYGTIEEFGAACAWLCSAHAGFVVGQNILLDGGQTNVTL